MRDTVTLGKRSPYSFCCLYAFYLHDRQPSQSSVWGADITLQLGGWELPKHEKRRIILWRDLRKTMYSSRLQFARQVPSSHWRPGQRILPNVPSPAASLPPAQPASLISMMNARGPCGGALGGGCRRGHYRRQNPRGGGDWGGSETLRIKNSINII